MGCNCKKQEEYFIYDLETGQKLKVTKEQSIAYRLAWENAKPKLNKEHKDKILYVGTKGELTEATDLLKLFYEQ